MADVDLVSVIYEYNPESPLFARVAETEMEKGNLQKAREILEAGFEHHPDYASAWFVYAILLAKLNDFEAARNMAKKADMLLNNHETYDYYLAKIESIENVLDDELYDDSEPAAPKKHEELKSFLSEYGDELFNSGSEKKEVTGSEMPDDKIVSETMANIHYSQGNYREALEVFKKLILKNPDKAELYKKKIDEINKLIAEKE